MCTGVWVLVGGWALVGEYWWVGTGRWVLVGEYWWVSTGKYWWVSTGGWVRSRSIDRKWSYHRCYITNGPLQRHPSPLTAEMFWLSPTTTKHWNTLLLNFVVRCEMWNKCKKKWFTPFVTNILVPHHRNWWHFWDPQKFLTHHQEYLTHPLLDSWFHLSTIRAFIKTQGLHWFAYM